MQFLITAPIFALIAIGYVAVRTGLVPRGVVPGIGQFVLYFAVPALIFRALLNADFGQVLNAGYLIAYAAGCMGTFVLIYGLLRFGMKRPITECGLKAFGSSFPNSIFIGFPILLHLFNEVPTAAFTMALLVENFVIFPAALIVMDIGAADGQARGLGGTLKSIGERLIKNPILVAIVAGSLGSGFGVQLPGIIEKIVDMLAQASPAAALFFIGGVLVGADIKGRLGSIATVTLARLVVNPLLVAVFMYTLPGIDPRLQVSAIIIAAAPMLAIYPIIGSKYGMAEESASTLLLATAASFVTISITLWVLV